MREEQCTQIIMEGQIAKIIIPMLKNQTVNTNQYQFALSKIKAPPLETLLVVDFCPLQRPNQQFECATPRFNHDRRHFTPAFLLPSDQKLYHENANFERLKFDDRIQNAQEKNIVDNNYKFVPACSYCQPCRANFEDYIQHMLSPSHCHQIAASFANAYIQQLASAFLQAPLPKRKMVKKSRKQRGKSAPKKNSCKILKEDLSNAGEARTTAAECKNSNQSTHLMSTSY